jgi:hypothetical protein
MEEKIDQIIYLAIDLGRYQAKWLSSTNDKESELYRAKEDAIENQVEQAKQELIEQINSFTA